MTDETETAAAETTQAAPETAAAAAAAQAGAEDDAAPEPRWWEGSGFTDAQRQVLTAKGLTVDDPLAAMPKLLDAYANAERRLGKPADRLIEKPAEGQDVAEWMRANGELFGVPKDAEGYEIERPEGWPKDAPWDSEMEAQARAIAHEHGVPAAALNAMVAMYAERVARVDAAAATDFEAASAELQEVLQKDWGGQYGARVAQAQQAASVVAEAAGLDNDALEAMAAVLKPKIGDANTLRMFAAIGEMLGEDSASGLGKGAASLGTTPAEARAERARLMAPGGAYFEASKAGDHTALARLKPRMEQLAKLAAE